MPTARIPWLKVPEITGVIDSMSEGLDMAENGQSWAFPSAKMQHTSLPEDEGALGGFLSEPEFRPPELVGRVVSDLFQCQIRGIHSMELDAVNLAGIRSQRVEKLVEGTVGISAVSASMDTTLREGV